MECFLTSLVTDGNNMIIQTTNKNYLLLLLSPKAINKPCFEYSWPPFVNVCLKGKGFFEIMEVKEESKELMKYLLPPLVADGKQQLQTLVPATQNILHYRILYLETSINI